MTCHTGVLFFGSPGSFLSNANRNVNSIDYARYSVTPNLGCEIIGHLQQITLHCLLHTGIPS